MDLKTAVEIVLKDAVARRDDATVEAYLEIFQRKRQARLTSHQEQVHAALKLGLRLGGVVSMGRIWTPEHR